MKPSSAFNEELSRFVRLFENEEKLREQVATLLSKFPGVTGVRITHGSQELGKDIVFFAQSGLDEKALHACVVKNGRITGSADSNMGARTVVNQAEQALDTPYTHTDGRQLVPSKVYIITPHDCPQATLNSVSAKLRQHAGRIEFLVGPDLLTLFKRYRPEFFLLEGDIFGIYMAALKKAVEKDTEITNIAFQANFLSSAARSLAERYVRPHFEVVVRRFDLTYSFPAGIDLNCDFTRIALKELQHSVQLLIALLETSGFQQALANTVSPSEVGTAAARLRELLPELVRVWESGLSDLKGTGVGKTLRGELLTVSIRSQKIKTEWQSTIDRVKDWTSRFRAIVKEVNIETAGAKQDPLGWLSAIAQTKYFSVADAAQLLTSAILRTRDEEVITLPPQLPETSRKSFLIIGAAGYGKTSFCRYNTLRDIESLLSGTSDRIPIYIPLHRLAQQPVSSLKDIMTRGAENEDCVLDVTAITERPLRMYLDGLDEIPVQERQRQTIEVIREAVQRMSNLQVIVTGRDYVSGPWLHWLARVRIAEFTDGEITEFVSRWTGSDESISKDFFAQMENVPNLKPLLRVPLLATLTLSVYSKTRQLPDTKGKLYDLFVSLLCGGWDDAKEVQRHGKYGPEIKKQVLTMLAAALHESKRRECGSRDVQKAMTGIAPLLKDQWPDMLDDLLKDGLLVSVGQSYAFAHLSFQEYLAAKELLATTPNRAIKRLHWYFQGDDWWKEVLSFYVGLLQNPEDAEQWILRGQRDVEATILKSPDLSSRVEFLTRRLLATFTAYELANRIY
jgi:hypothetical protein